MSIIYKFFLLIFVSLVISGCSTLSVQKTDIPSFPFANTNLLVSSIPDRCISVINVDTKEEIGAIKHDEFRLVQDFAVTDNNYLYLPLNADPETLEKRVLLLSLTEDLTSSIEVNDGPVQVRLGNGEYSLLTHNAITENPGHFDVTIMSKNGERQLYTVQMPGLVKDVLLRNNMAYLALEDWKDMTNHQLIEFDLSQRKQIRSLPLPAPPVSLTASAYEPNVLYVALQRLSNEGSCMDAPLSEILEVRLDSYTSRTITKLSWPGKLVELDQEHVLVAEYCGGNEEHLRKVNIKTGQVVQERVVGASPFDLFLLPDNTIAATITDEDKVVFLEPTTLAIQKEVKLSCVLPRVMQLYER